MKLQDKRILITGAAGGLGTALMQTFLHQGAHVIGIDKQANPLHTKHEIIVADIRNLETTKQAVREAIDRLEGVDILINNAGVLHLQDAGAPPDQGAMETIDVNLHGLWGTTAAALPALLESQGRIINIASLFAVVNAPFIPAYSATKRAVSAYSDVLRLQYGDRIGVTTLYPGYMKTAIHDEAERQGLSVARVVTFSFGQHKLISFEESLDAAARGVARACTGRPMRDRGVTFNGTLTLLLARHLPSLVDAFVKWRLNRLMKAGMQVVLDAP